VNTSPPSAVKKVSARSLRFKTWEWLLLIVSLAVTTGAALIYSTGYPIRNWIFGLEDTELDRPIGKVSNAQGSIRRQLRRNPEFKNIPMEETLYNRDTVVTGPDSGATLEIDEVGAIELGANTMVRLVFAEQGALSGIKRATVVDVIQGSVTGKAKAAPILLRSKTGVTEIAKNTDKKVEAPKPVPVLKVARVQLPPMPTVVNLPPAPAIPIPPPVAPVSNTAPYRITLAPEKSLRLGDTESQPLIPVQIGWSGGPAETQLQVEVFKEGSAQPAVAEKITSRTDRPNSWKTELREVGLYTWRLKDAEGKPIQLEGNLPAEGQFRVQPEWKKVAAMKPLVGGQEKDNNDFEGGPLARSPAITLRWKPMVANSLISSKAATLLKVWNADNPTQVLFEGKVNGTQFEFSKDRLHLGKIAWSVSVPAQGGFMLTSGPQEFQVRFNPPSLVEPALDASFSRSKLSKSSDGSILLTWKKTLYTDYYEVEVASDSDFKQIVWRLKPKENYALFRTNKDQSFWWRVRSANASGSSSFNSGRKFNVGP